MSVVRDVKHRGNRCGIKVKSFERGSVGMACRLLAAGKTQRSVRESGSSSSCHGERSTNKESFESESFAQERESDGSQRPVTTTRQKSAYS